jgi:hypothetical protein
MALDNSKNVLRDWPFTFALPVCEFPMDEYRESRIEHPASSIEHRVSSIETIIVQGIIDMLIQTPLEIPPSVRNSTTISNGAQPFLMGQTPKGLIVIDFKTDDISAGQVPRRAELYRQQLNLYARAASSILKSESATKWLYFLTPSCAIKI